MCRPGFYISLVKSEMSISRISMSRVAGLCLDGFVCVVWWYLCSVMLKKSLKVTFLWRGLVCVKGGEYLSSDGLHEKSHLDDLIFWIHLRPIKWQNWQIRHPFSALLLTYSFLCPPFLSSPLVFLFYLLKFTLLELTVIFEIDLPVMCTLNIKCCLKGLCLNGISPPFSFFQWLKKAPLSFHLAFFVAHI